MREILFKAKSIDENNKGEWVQGYYRHFVSGEKYDRHYIDSAGEPQITTWIDIDTLGQIQGSKTNTALRFSRVMFCAWNGLVIAKAICGRRVLSLETLTENTTGVFNLKKLVNAV